MEFPVFILYLAIGVSFYASFMGGANDFANAFGTSVGSKAITIRQAVIIAIIAELLGAVLVGGHVTDTVRKGIVDPTNFQAEPMVLVYGLLAALIGSGLFLQLATHFGLPVSTTHAIVGAMVGFGIVSTGFGGVKWLTVWNIVLSWVISPIGGGIVAFATFRIIQRKVLENSLPLLMARKVVPVFVGLTVMVVGLSVVYKGMKNLHLNMPLSEALVYSFILGIISYIIVRFSMNRDTEGKRSEQINKVEGSFKFLQIFTAGYVAFAHGANDVANSIGPLAGIWSIYKSGIVGLQAEVPYWILLLGGTGIIIGLAVLGYKVIETIGSKITAMTPSRGFSAEFSAASVVLIFSKLGMPVSTTHTLVGSVIGVGLARGIGALDFRVVRQIFMSWVVTIPLAALGTIIAFEILKFTML